MRRSRRLPADDRADGSRAARCGGRQRCERNSRRELASAREEAAGERASPARGRGALGRARGQGRQSSPTPSAGSRRSHSRLRPRERSRTQSAIGGSSSSDAARRWREERDRGSASRHAGPAVESDGEAGPRRRHLGAGSGGELIRGSASANGGTPAVEIRRPRPRRFINRRRREELISAVATEGLAAGGGASKARAPLLACAVTGSEAPTDSEWELRRLGWIVTRCTTRFRPRRKQTGGSTPTARPCPSASCLTLARRAARFQ